MNAPDRTGSFRAEITSYGLREMESGAISVALCAKLTEWYDGTEWHDWLPYDMEATGDVWIIKKDGTINQASANSLMRYAGWDGNIESIAGETWQPLPCQVLIQEDTYKDQTRRKIAFVNDWARTPGVMSNVTPDKAREIQTRYGSQFRAMAGNANRNSAPSIGRPMAPPPRKQPVGPPPPQPNDPVDNNVPF